jgi:hypothetical protein
MSSHNGPRPSNFNKLSGRLTHLESFTVHRHFLTSLLHGRKGETGECPWLQGSQEWNFFTDEWWGNGVEKFIICHNDSFVSWITLRSATKENYPHPQTTGFLFSRNQAEWDQSNLNTYQVVLYFKMATGAVVVVWQLYLQLSVPITTEVGSSNPAHGEVCSIQNYVSLSVTCNMSMVFSTSKTDCHDITEILLKMALNTTTITHNLSKWKWTGPYSFSFAWIFRIHIQTWLHLRTSSFWVSMTGDLESCPPPKRDIHVPMSDNTKLSELCFSL